MADARPVLGILGGGQLGRMLAQAAEALGVETRLYDPASDACGGQVAPLTSAPWDDLDAVRRWAEGCDVVTYEFENVPEATARAAMDVAPLRPGLEPLLIAQDRVRERALFGRLGIPTPRWSVATSAAELAAIASDFLLPALVKATRGGYDGKGQMKLLAPDQAELVFGELGGGAVIIDELVPFDREVSVVAVRTGEAFASFPLVENVHRRGILVRTLAPASRVVDVAGVSGGGALADALGYMGVLAVEFFDVGGRLLANEFACRVHNTGHWTMDGGGMSQFEAHVRGVMGMPLEPWGPDRPTVMANLIGAVPGDLAARLPAAARLHVYGKAPRPGRKVGHVNILADELPGGMGEAIVLADRILEGNVYTDR